MAIEVLTALLVLITFFYAWTTYRILKANEKVVAVMQDEVEALNRPYISVSLHLKPSNPIFYLRIRNTGKTAAKNLRLKIDKDFYQFAEENEKSNIAKFNAFTKAIESFPPDTELEFALAQSFVVFGDKANDALTPLVFNITATYSYTNKEVTEKTTVDLTPYLNSDIPQDSKINELMKIKKAIEEQTKKLAKP